MKRTLVAAALCAAVLLGSAMANADTPADKTKKAAAPAMTPEQQAMMAEMEKNAMPGKEHALLGTMSGKWKATVKTWMSPGDPQVTEGTMDNEMEFGGRVLEGKFKGEMMGAKFNGLSIMGYDNAKKEYWSFWTDDMSTSSMMTTGPASTDGKTITTKGMMEGMDGKPTEHVLTTTIVNPDQHVFTMSMNMGGQMTKVMEITYNRVGTKSAAADDK